MAITPSGWLLRSFGSGEGGVPPVIPAAESYSPASIISQYLINKTVANLPPTLPWPVYVSVQPDAPTNVLTTFDTDSLLDGRYMRRKKYISHRGVQVRIRGINYPTGYAKAVQIRDTLQQANRESVELVGETWRIDNVSFTSDVLSIGQEPESRKDIFVINTRCSLTLL
jgi:hypothetical protein